VNNEPPEVNDGPYQARLRLVGQRVRRIRRDQDITQESLADRVGIRPATLIDLEKGRSDPKLSTFLMIADALGVDPSDLLQ
jgi:transcriptional regulator with XRE-family HTH domain